MYSFLLDREFELPSEMMKERIDFFLIDKSLFQRYIYYLFLNQKVHFDFLPSCHVLIEWQDVQYFLLRHFFVKRIFILFLIYLSRSKIVQYKMDSVSCSICGAVPTKGTA